MRESGVPLQLINGRNDLVAGVCWVKKLGKALKCPLILTGKALAPELALAPKARLISSLASLRLQAVTV